MQQSGYRLILGLFGQFHPPEDVLERLYEEEDTHNVETHT